MARTTETDCLEALREAAERLGESPSKAAYEELGLTPASATIIRQVGSWNEAKERAGLETNPSRGPRVEPKPEDVDLPEDIDWTELSVDQRWHYRNRERNGRRTLRRRARLRQWVNRKKQQRGCRVCGTDDPACLDFHHREGTEKEMDIGTMVTYGHGRDSLREEIAKCGVLCANCHRKEHHAPPEGGLRGWVYDRKVERGGCSECGVDDPTCLDLHHGSGEKEDTVARMLADGRPKSAIRAEMAKCRVLCANCHRKLHFDPPDPENVGKKSGEHDNHK